MAWGEAGFATTGPGGAVLIRDPGDATTRRTVSVRAWARPTWRSRPTGRRSRSPLAMGSFRSSSSTAPLRWETRHPGPVNGLSVSADGSRVAASWSASEQVRVFDLSSGARVATVPDIVRGRYRTESRRNHDRDGHRRPEGRRGGHRHPAASRSLRSPRTMGSTGSPGVPMDGSSRPLASLRPPTSGTPRPGRSSAPGPPTMAPRRPSSGPPIRRGSSRARRTAS